MGAIESMSVYWNDRLTGALRQVQAPVRCINSGRYPTDIEAGSRYASSFEAVEMPGVGHFVMNEDPETFNRLLEKILAEFVYMADW